MSLKKNLNQRIDEYILQNPKLPNEVGYYARIAQLFSIHPEKARKRWRMLYKTKEPLQSSYFVQKIQDVGENSASLTCTTVNNTTNITTIDTTVDEKVENLEDLVRVCNIDTDKYEVTHFQVKSYLRFSNGEQKQVYSVKASLKAKKVDTHAPFQKDIILDEIRKESLAFKLQQVVIPVESFVEVLEDVERDSALEINIPDLHIGKLAWGKESGEDYDIKIAIDRYKKAVKDLVARVNVLSLEKIILPVGNDMINIDNKANTTTGGTPQSCDSRFGKMFQAAKKLLIETIDYLSQLAPVEVIVIPGNHDTVAMFTLGEVLDAWYHNNEEVTVINTHTPRKYLQYGANLIMYTHGHNEKLQDLGIICATEQPQLWAATKFRRVHVGHLHHSKQIKFTDIQEYPGFTVKVLNSLSANDAWHSEKGYNSLKGAEAFLYHRDRGLLANFYYLNQ
jgi:hypothetical protein